MSLHKIYIRILILVLVLGPFTWLMFTDEGQRVGDIFMLELGDSEALNLNFAKLSSHVSEENLKEQFPQVELACVDQNQAYGTRQCSAPISAINGTPAQYVTFFFMQNQLIEANIGYQPSYHQHLYQGLLTTFGAGEAGPEAGMRRWNTGYGLLYAPPQTLMVGTKTILIWKAKAP